MKLTEIKGIGEKTKNALESKGIFSCEELAMVLPSSYREISKPTKFLPNSKSITLKLCLLETPKTTFLKGRTITRSKAQDVLSGRVISLSWFNQKFASKAYKCGETYFAYGSSRANDFTVSLMKKNEQELVGMYASYKKMGIKRNVLVGAILGAIEKCGVPSQIPSEIEQKHNLYSLQSSHIICHTSKSRQELKNALHRVQLEQAVKYLQQEGNLRLQTRKQRNAIDCSALPKIISKLPFSLTNSQTKAIKDIITDLSKSLSMNRLVMGDVGSGKTLVAFVSALLFIKNGYQVAFMAPTEILAEQHYKNFIKYFGSDVKSVLLTSSQKDKAKILTEIEDGGAKIVFGTHILSIGTKFSNLGLCVIDEQQRFGVEARANLVQKSATGDTLSLSATPIPRTMLLALSGTMQSTKMEERPYSFNTKTHFVVPLKENDMWEYVKEQEKTFVVCPKIEEEESELGESEMQNSVISVEKSLKKRFGKSMVERIDGTLSKEEQDRAMQRFSSSDAKILVATTVIEVGVDVSNATTMVIMGADRFGLSSLHQLRGRIGRNGKESHCFILLGDKFSTESKKRLDFFRTHTSGFEIAEFDFSSRGAGDVFGTQQSGDYALPFNAEILEEAKAIVAEIGKQKSVLVANN